MKKLIIILAVVALSFIGLLIYGGSGSQEPKRPCQQLPKDDKGNYKVPDNWCPPSIAKATRSLQVRFAPGLDLEQEKVELDVSPQQDNMFDVPPVGDPDKHRTAKLTLVSGSWAIVEGPSDAKQCLCKPGRPLPPQLVGGACGANWREDHQKKQWMCQSTDKFGTIPIEWMGGRLTFKQGPAARVEVK
jgi:hypothetical protein